jgi:hypothetical protein
MTGLTKKSWYVAAAVILCLAPCAFADTAQMTLTSAGNNVMNGVYVGAYTATINGVVGQQVICDDFSDESYLNTPWTATVHTFADLSGTLWSNLPNYVTLYEQAAWLTVQMLAQPGGSKEQGYYSFAIWAIFNPTAVKNQVGSAFYTQYILPLIQLAQGQKLDPSMFANFLIYTPACTHGAGTCQSQEFFGLVNTPEGGSAALYLLFASLACVVAMRFRLRRPVTGVGSV